MHVTGFIPARMASSRFPNKPLAKILGISMLEHVFMRAKRARLMNDLYVTTCDEEIVQETLRFGGKVIKTSLLHKRGTERVAEAASTIDTDLVINIQGDEPLVSPEALDGAISMMSSNKSLTCLNLVSQIKEKSIFQSPDVVKTVVDGQGRALYFSRLPIPYSNDSHGSYALKQIGIYLFRKSFLTTFINLPETPLEKMESVDMLRILEHGYPIHTYTCCDMISVDTIEDLREVEKVMHHDSLCQKLFKQTQ